MVITPKHLFRPGRNFDTPTDTVISLRKGLRTVSVTYIDTTYKGSYESFFFRS
jgi:hypothetical protein